MISIKGTLAALLFVIILIFTTVCGAFIGVRFVMRQDNITALVTSYAAQAPATPGKSALQTLVMQSEYGKEELSGMAYLGLSELSSIINFFRDKYGLISLFLNALDADRLFTEDALLHALDAAEAKGLPAKGETARAAFLNSGFAVETAVKAAFICIDYPHLADRSELRALVKTYAADLSKKHSDDLTAIFGRPLSPDDGEALDAFADALAASVCSGMQTPEIRTTSLRGATKTLISACTSNGFIFATAFMALLTALLFYVLRRNVRTTLFNVGCAITVSGAAVWMMIAAKETIVGRSIIESGRTAGNTGQSFAVTGVILLIAGLLMIIVPSVFESVRKKRNRLILDISADTMTPSDVRVISEMGLGDLVMKKENPNRRPDGLVDYYGDGRGLDAQRAFRAKIGADVPSGSDGKEDRGEENKNADGDVPGAEETAPTSTDEEE